MGIFERTAEKLRNVRLGNGAFHDPELDRIEEIIDRTGPSLDDADVDLLVQNNEYFVSGIILLKGLKNRNISELTRDQVDTLIGRQTDFSLTVVANAVFRGTPLYQYQADELIGQSTTDPCLQNDILCIASGDPNLLRIHEIEMPLRESWRQGIRNSLPTVSSLPALGQ